jgi:hypothetical protein
MLLMAVRQPGQDLGLLLQQAIPITASPVQGECLGDGPQGEVVLPRVRVDGGQVEPRSHVIGVDPQGPQVSLAGFLDPA